MFSVQMVMNIRTLAQTSTWLELELISIRREPDHNAQLATGLLFIGLEDSRTEELSLTPRWKVTKDQRHSPLVTIKYSNAGILLLPNSTKVILVLLTAHHPKLTVILSPGHQLEVNQSHSTLTLTSKLRFSSVEEPLNSFNNHHSQ